jgi:nucleoside phosphorylase
MWVDPPIYLHFLDRELGGSVGFTPTAIISESAIKCLLIGTTSRLYTGLSLVWESPAMESRLNAFLVSLTQQGALDLISAHSTIEEFLDSRRRMYRHDADRYPMYFRPEATHAEEVLGPTHFKSSSATLALAREIGDWAAKAHGEIRRDTNESLEEHVLRSIRGVLAQRDDQAVTYPLFARDVEKIATRVRVEPMIRRRISLSYTEHYKAYGGADIPTGIVGLSYFDRSTENFPIFDIEVLTTILENVGFCDVLRSPWKTDERVWLYVGAWRGTSTHIAFREDVVLLLKGVVAWIEGQREISNDNLYARRSAIVQTLKSSFVAVTPRMSPARFEIEYAIAQLRGVFTYLQRDKAFGMALSKVGADTHKHCDTLLVTATEVERDAVLQRAREITGKPHQLHFGLRRTYFDLGYVGGARIFLVQSEAGSASPGGSHATVADAIDECAPTNVIMVGIAFGIDESKQSLGEILVSRQLQCYEMQRVGTDKTGARIIIPRGDKVTVPTRLLGRVRACSANWTSVRVLFGLLLSGEKLIDNIDYRNEIHAFEPEAMGGEMEGVGLYGAASERRKDWIIVKAICDWADGKKRFRKTERQQLAARNSVNFVFEAISQGGFGPVHGQFLES